VSSWFSVVPDGSESSISHLLDAQQKTDAAWSERIARALAHTPRGDLVIRNARLFDPRDLSVSPATSVVVSGERIVRVGQDSDIKPSANAEIIDAKGRFLMPGLWDNHQHFSDNDGALATAHKTHQLPHEGYPLVHFIAGQALEHEGHPQQAFAEYVPVRAKHASFNVFTCIRYQRFFNRVRMVNENRLEIQDSDTRDVAIFAREFREVFERSVIERTERPPPEPFGGSWRKFIASRTPHATMLCRGLVLVKRRIYWMEESRYRSARIRKPLRHESTAARENPAAVSLAGTVVGCTGTNVLRMCPMRFSHPS
jgi:hypothetical protein